MAKWLLFSSTCISQNVLHRCPVSPASLLMIPCRLSRLYGKRSVTKLPTSKPQPDHDVELNDFNLTSKICRASWSHLQTTRAPVDARLARERGLSKSRPFNLWQWYKHELLVYYDCCICRMAVKSET